MSKYSKKLIDSICELIRTDSYTIAEICSLLGISESTYHEWKDKKPEFSEAIKKAKGEFNEFIIAEAKKSLIKKIRGYMIQEVRTVNVASKEVDNEGSPIIVEKEKIVTDKYFQPDTATIIFTLCNRDPDNWKNRQDTNISGEMTLISDLDKLPDEELENIIRNGGKIDTESET